ncbi:type IV secretion system protein [Vibrio parahaemolyticus]|uniref:type IV secretion system protein n=1 Tax=Vibrio parahaemolyticus TaxID=670 RepID=UPI002806D40F|nr:type IV secretion system protein [Vibrio parahaemolyticus]EJE4644420.1 type IV secretion system protein [Vibrio parahaemolyticus]ELA9292967.1 type IV secretion system protein [Vibrio parahaemolyticus]MDS1925663.1 type IV secretion system protein [Vibrio parahaemolyticus]
MAFQLFTPLFEKVDDTTATFVSDISSRAIAEATPVVTVAMSLGILMYGMLVVRGAVQTPVMEFIGRALKISIITSIALAGGLYQSDIADAITKVPDELATALITDATTGSSAAGIVDVAASKGFDAAGEAFSKAEFFSGDGLVYGLFGLIILVSTAIMTAIGGAFVLLAKVALALLAGLGPFFILALLFQPTVRFFEMWTAQVLNYGLTVILFSAVFGFLMDIFGNYMGDIRFDGTQNVAYSLGGALILACAAVLILLQLPSIASGLSGGVGVGFIHEMRQMAGMGSSMAKGVSRGGGMLFSRGEKNSDGTRGKATGAIPAMYRGGQKAAGYFKGGKAA